MTPIAGRRATIAEPLATWVTDPLRAMVSLCRLWQQQGKPDEARERLAEIYSWFTEGFDTLDLREGRALLEALSSRT